MKRKNTKKINLKRSLNTNHQKKVENKTFNFEKTKIPRFFHNINKTSTSTVKQTVKNEVTESHNITDTGMPHEASQFTAGTGWHIHWKLEFGHSARAAHVLRSSAGPLAFLLCPSSFSFSV